MDTNKGGLNPTKPGDADDRKLRRKRQRRLFGDVCYEYTQSTSLQGLPFLTKEGLTITERIFWILTIIASLIMCGYLIEDVWTKWQTSPVIVTVSEQPVPVIKVPLPAITICPQAKCKLSVYNYTGFVDKYKYHSDEFYKLGLEERIKFAGITLLCTQNMLVVPMMLRKHNFTTITQINEVALDYEDVFHLCNINEKYVECSQLFSKTLTASGVCYTMNVLAADEILRMENIQKDFSYLSSSRKTQNWSLQHGYTGYDSVVYPIPGLASDTTPSVSITFRQKLTDYDALCHGSSPGFQIYVQHPGELPQTSLYTQSLMVNEQAALALSFSIMNTSETLRNYHPEVRQCYFPEDRQLKYFKIYTAKNCRTECLANFTLSTCGCVPFYLPHSNSDQICGVARRLCAARAEEKLSHREVNENAADRCRCLEACNSITYDAQLMKTGYYQDSIEMSPLLKSSALHLALPTNLSGVLHSQLKIFYKSPQFISMRRSELFGVTDFLANCGGLLGLFLGFSFLSLVEIIYFFTLRLCCALRKDRTQEKTNSLEKTDGHELTEECLPTVCEKDPNPNNYLD